MTRIEFIKEELKKDIQRTKDLLQERINVQDFAGALMRKSEVDGLMRAWNIVCSGDSFDEKWLK